MGGEGSSFFVIKRLKKQKNKKRQQHLPNRKQQQQQQQSTPLKWKNKAPSNKNGGIINPFTGSHSKLMYA